MRVRDCVVVASLLVNVSYVSAAPVDVEFTSAKQTFVKEMKKPAANTRAAAVATFAKIPRPGTAELLLKRGLFDSELKVRLATRAGLRQLADDATVSGYLINELKKSIKKSIANEMTLEMLRALVASDIPERQVELIKFIDEFLATPKGNLLVPITLIDEFADQSEDDYTEQREQDPARAVAILSRAKVFESHFGYRRTIVQAMSKIRKLEAVDFLIELLPKTEGLIQADIVSYLTAVTKQRLRADAAGWAEWWEKNRDTFEFPDGEIEPDDDDIASDQLTYYRIPICAKRIVFVLDSSGSMHGTPILAAKQALINAIDALPEVVHFGVVMFDRQADAWQPRLVSATADAKKNAARAIVARPLAPLTASGAALSVAFKLEPEAIYFLSDGEPTDDQPGSIVNACSELNRVRRISIHTIGVTTAGGHGGLSMFMKPLSSRNYGKFVLID
ncbi:VWA domain-containing protein [Schlesneria paludicola]|uniref:VWA domain-containing protein n=1 Tax=Schlesneria paludicola TaxID=360056 RepID=UPI00029A8F01|nr:VWA domain-containing protein [Schlesneria paludicola]